MTKAFPLFLWENTPSVNTPLGQTLLNKVNVGLSEVDDRVIVLNTTKANQTEMLTAIDGVSLDTETGVLTFYRKNGATIVLDTGLAKTAINLDFDDNAQQFVLCLADGTEKRIDVSAFITQTEFVESGTTYWTVSSDGKVQVDIKKGSITADMLEPNYLANVQLYANNALESANNAKISEENAKASETVASEKADMATTAENNANAYAEQAKSSEAAAGNSATTAIEQAAVADNSAKAALTSEANAKESEDNAKASAEKSFVQASMAESYTKGGTGTRDGEDTDNAKYYMEQTKAIAGANIAINDQTPTYTVAEANANLKSGEKLSVAFGKIAKAISSLISHLADSVSHITTDERTAWNSKAAGVHKHTKSEITDFPTSMPASDVYSWAKASTKPDYTKAEVGLGNVDNTADSAKSVKYAESAGSANAVTWGNVSSKPSSYTPSAHNQSASTITAGTLAGQVVANDTAVKMLNIKQVRNIYAGEDTLEAGATALPTGDIYIKYK